MLPRNIILVRHGESEGNIANKHSRKGDNSDFSPEFLDRHSSKLRLTDKGKTQAKMAGDWLKSEGLDRFDGYYVSEYTRAMETAALMELPDANWQTDFQLRERDHGLVDILPHSVREEQFANYMRLRKMHLFYAPWPDGESIPEVCERLRSNIMDTLHREMADKQVVIVSHGDLIRAFRVILEHMPADVYHEVDGENQKYFKVGNGQIIHYTRVNPNDPNEVLPHLGWVRSVNPYKPTFAGHDWQPIVRKKYTNAELLALAERSKRLVNE